jgi:hypothetical protein
MERKVWGINRVKTCANPAGGRTHRQFIYGVFAVDGGILWRKEKK